MGNFYTDVISKNSRFNSTNRIDDLALLEPVTRQLVLMIIQQAANMGFDMMVFETYRSKARQQELFKQGATQLRQVGVHHYGLACDIVKKVNGEPSWKGDFSFVGQLAHSAGLIWGGDWGTPNQHHSFIDQPHVQRCTVARQGDLFAGNWYPDTDYNPYQDEPHFMLANALAEPMDFTAKSKKKNDKGKSGMKKA
jgi:hypothetical protein